MSQRKKVALVLAGGGAKGYAHIGAIEALEDAGYEITSVAGTSMGALIGGIYASGGLDSVKEWMFGLTRSKVYELADFTFSPGAVLKGEDIMDALKEMVPDCRIEDLRIPYCAVATNLNDGSEVVLRSGSLYDAIRASISIPMLFSPVEYDGMRLVDGGITNGLPLDRVVRTDGDLLVAVNLDDYKRDDDSDDAGESKDKDSAFGNLLRRAQTTLRNVRDNNYVSLAYATISILMKRNTEMALRLTPPDIYLNVDLGEYSSHNFDKAEAIAELGRTQMQKVLANFGK